MRRTLSILAGLLVSSAANAVGFTLVSTTGPLFGTGSVSVPYMAADGEYAINAMNYMANPFSGSVFITLNDFPTTIDSRQQNPFPLTASSFNATAVVTDGIVSSLRAYGYFLYDVGAVTRQSTISLLGSTFNFDFVEYIGSGPGTMRHSSGNIVFEPQVSAVPEPETYALFVAGLAVLGWRRQSYARSVQKSDAALGSVM